MPPLQVIKALGQPVFFGGGHKLPHKFQAATDKTGQDHYGKAFKPADKGAIPQLMPPWFMPAEPGNKYYVDSCDRIGNEFKTFHDAMLDAVVFAHTKWKALAKFKDIKIMAIAAIGAPGCLDGPSLESDIKNAPSAMAFSGHKAKHRDAVAKGVAKCFKDWQDMVTVPGLPWYPTFAAFPGPMAPPMPNVPTPLIMCPSGQMAAICTPTLMASAMTDALDGSVKDKDEDKHHASLHKAIATVLAAAFTTWLPMQQVMLVLGKGPIPTFAPPVMPAGPVMGGDIISAPGHLIS